MSGTDLGLQLGADFALAPPEIHHGIVSAFSESAACLAGRELDQRLSKNT